MADNKNNLVPPKIAVLFAAYNGMNYLAEQLDSVLGQVEVDVTIYVSADVSTDGTESWLNKRASEDSRMIVLRHGRYFGGASRNFFRLLTDVDFSNFDYVSFADQDDIWESDKLISHVLLMQKNDVDGVSSNVIAFWPNGKKKLVNKAQPQRELDYLFESAGPGCTFLMTPWLVGEVKKLLVDPSSIANKIALHDWLFYAVCRASGRKWLIDSKPSLHYRQHGQNVVGANSGLMAKLARLKKISNGWYRQEVLKVARVACSLSNDAKLCAILGLLEKSDFLSRLKLLRLIPQARRKLSDRLFLAFMIISGLF